MKKIILALLFAFSLCFADDGIGISSSVKNVVSSVVSSGKDAIKGAKEGIDEGRQSGSSVDGAIIIADKEKLNQYASISILSVEQLEEYEYKVTLGIKNVSDETIRLINLNEKKSLQLLDKDGFASFVSGIVEDITVPEKSGIRVRYHFNNQEELPSILRIYGMEIPVAKETIKLKK